MVNMPVSEDAGPGARTDTAEGPSAVVGRLLDDARVEHGPVVLLGRSNHMHFSDRETVLVKVGLPWQGEALRTELSACRALGSGGLSPEAVVPELLTLGERPVAVLRYVPSRRSADATCLNTVAARTAVEALRRVHATPPWPGCGALWDRLTASAARRIQRIADGGVPCADEMLAALKRWVLTVEDEMARKEHWGLVHGDALCQNMLVGDEGGFDRWCDFEGAGIGPREWDVACLNVSLMHSGTLPNRASWFVVRREFSQAPLEWAMVDRLVLAKLAMRASHMALAGHPHESRTCLDHLARLASS